jgi:hypothetical protein
MVCTTSVPPTGWTRVQFVLWTKISLLQNDQTGSGVSGFSPVLNQPGHEANRGGLSSC